MEIPIGNKIPSMIHTLHSSFTVILNELTEELSGSIPDPFELLSSSMTTGTTPVTMVAILFLSISFFCLSYILQVEAVRFDWKRRFRPVLSPFHKMLLSSRWDDPTNTNTTESFDADNAPDDMSYSSLSLPSPNGKSRSSFLLPSSFDMSFLNDLAPPFSNATEDEQFLTAHVDSPDVTHFCFLLHGHRGLSKDLTYMQTVMRRVAVLEKRKRGILPLEAGEEYVDYFYDPAGSDGEDSAESDNTPPPSPPSTQEEEDDGLTHDMVVHNAVCNEGKTQDGIRNAGDRLVEEMREVIRNEMEKRHPELGSLPSRDDFQQSMELFNVTISILGNSLGGLFGRYAIAKLVERYCIVEEGTDNYILDGCYRVHLNIFCTTATPHLGISQHTYVKIPRTAEIGFAHAMGNTGKDLFRLNDLLHTMATSPAYLDPLSKFRKRIAYANAYGTDFPVPASTAAFLSQNSSYPHHFQDEEYQIDSIIATLHTPTAKSKRFEEYKVSEEDLLPDAGGSVLDSSSHERTHDDETELDQMSQSLDKLGWKKVFVDIRRELPGAELPKSLWMRRQQSDSRLILDDAEMSLNSLKNRNEVVQSKDVATAVDFPSDNRISLPLGHNMIVAFSRSRISTFMNKGGRPVVDNLARELVQDIFKWDDSRDETKHL